EKCPPPLIFRCIRDARGFCTSEWCENSNGVGVRYNGGGTAGNNNVQNGESVGYNNAQNSSGSVA
ncbi:5322_t:CDS:1, partial [Ambispora gerdemannii]